jgi:hypothetical protein
VKAPPSPFYKIIENFLQKLEGGEGNKKGHKVVFSSPSEFQRPCVLRAVWAKMVPIEVLVASGVDSWPRRGHQPGGKKTFFLSSFPHRFFLSRFLAVSVHEEPKNTKNIFSKIRPENLKKSQKR